MENVVQIVKPVKAIIYDFETNGFLDLPEIQPISLSVKIINVDGSIKDINKYINCEHPLSTKITEITGLTNADLDRYGQPLEDVIKEFEEVLFSSECDGNNTPFVVVGHNILRFDNPLYAMMQTRIGGVHHIKDKYCFDTGGQFKGELLKWTKYPNYKHYEYHSKCLDAKSWCKWNLTAAGKHYGIASTGVAHTASGDVENCFQVFIKQLKKIGRVPENLIQYEL